MSIISTILYCIIGTTSLTLILLLPSLIGAVNVDKTSMAYIVIRNLAYNLLAILIFAATIAIMDRHYHIL